MVVTGILEDLQKYGEYCSLLADSVNIHSL